MVGKQGIFYTGGALPAGHPTYTERQADAECRYLLGRDQMFYVLAPRQMGKTSLLKRLSSQLVAAGWASCVIDLSTLKRSDPARWYHEIGTQIARSCGHNEISNPLQDQIDLRRLILALLGPEGLLSPKQGLVLFLDEVEGLLGLEFAEVFLMTLRDLYQGRDELTRHFLMGFAGCIDPDALIQDSHNSPFNVAKEVALLDLSKLESIKLTSNLAKLGAEIDEGVHGSIYHWTAGQPHLTQRICEILEEWTATRHLTLIDPDVVQEAVRKYLLAPYALDSNVKHVMKEVHSLQPPAERLWQRLTRQQSVNFREPGYYSLYLTGAVRHDEEGRVYLRNPIYEHVLLHAKAEPELQRGRAPEDPIHVKIGRGVPGRETGPSTHTEATMWGTGKRWAVVVGADTYDDKLHYGRLHVCSKDARSMHMQLVASGYEPERTRILTDDAGELPNRDNVLVALSAIAKATEHDDTLLFFYSGHGDVDNRESFLVSRSGKHLSLEDTAIRISRIKQIMEQAPARAKIIILDACHSGAEIEGKGPQRMSEEFIRRVFLDAAGLAILASCEQGQVSYEWQANERSVFTYFLLEALEGEADLDGKGFVTIQDINRYVSNGVKLWASQRDCIQTPTLQADIAGDLIVAYMGDGSANC